MELILLGHIIGDFYVQTDKIAEKKKSSIKYMLIHCLMYTIVMEICFYILSRKIEGTLIISIFVSVPSRRAMACVFIRKRQIFAAFL